MTEDERVAARDILNYIQKQPNAKHTAEGISRYWIFQQCLEEKLEIVLNAIDYLVNEGFLEEVQKEDKQYYYCANKGKIDDISSAIDILRHGL